MSVRVDLHTHSYGSNDGGLNTEDYRSVLSAHTLDYVAITDHGTIAVAEEIKKALGPLGKRIIIGQEIMTTSGEIIGLYLKESIADGLSPTETVAAIRAQNGLVYIPHPFETMRSGIDAMSLQTIIHEVDIIEACNGRAVFENRSKQASAWARTYDLPAAASSDAHGKYGWGGTFAVLTAAPTRTTLAELLRGARYETKKVGIGILYPKYNRLRRKIGRQP